MNDTRKLHTLKYSDGLMIDGVAYDIVLGRDVSSSDLKKIPEGKKYGPRLSRLTLLIQERVSIYQPKVAPCL